MKNPNSFSNRMKRYFIARWSDRDTPASEPRFQINLLIKDIAIFIFLPLGTALIFQVIDTDLQNKPNKRKVKTEAVRDLTRDQSKSQIIEFSKAGAVLRGNGNRKAPGTIVKVRLLNTVETYGNAPVHAQVIDGGLGQEWVGGTLIGDANSDQTYDRVNITFRLVKSAFQPELAQTIKARALSLNGTLGVNAEKKEGFFARSALNSANPAAQNAEKETDSLDVKHFLAKALANGLLQEFGSSASNERAKSQVYVLNPGDVFFIELTDYFPGEGR